MKNNKKNWRDFAKKAICIRMSAFLAFAPAVDAAHANMAIEVPFNSKYILTEAGGIANWTGRAMQTIWGLRGYGAGAAVWADAAVAAAPSGWGMAAGRIAAGIGLGLTAPEWLPIAAAVAVQIGGAYLLTEGVKLWKKNGGGWGLTDDTPDPVVAGAPKFWACGTVKGSARSAVGSCAEGAIGAYSGGVKLGPIQKMGSLEIMNANGGWHACASVEFMGISGDGSNSGIIGRSVCADGWNATEAEAKAVEGCESKLINSSGSCAAAAGGAGGNGGNIQALHDAIKGLDQTKKLSDQALAGMLNKMWQEASEDPTYNGPRFDEKNAITADEVSQVAGAKPTVADLTAGWAGPTTGCAECEKVIVSPHIPIPGATTNGNGDTVIPDATTGHGVTVPIPGHSDVITDSRVTDKTISNTKTETKTDTSAGTTTGEAASAPAIDYSATFENFGMPTLDKPAEATTIMDSLMAKLKYLRSFDIEIADVACPSIKFSVSSKVLGKGAGETTFEENGYCAKLEEQRSNVEVILKAGMVIGAIITIMTA